MDERAVVGLERDAEVELDDAVRAPDRPVVAARQHLAAEPLAFERAAGDRKRDARAVRPGADVLRGRVSDEASSADAFAWRSVGEGEEREGTRAPGERRERGEPEDLFVDVHGPHRTSSIV